MVDGSRYPEGIAPSEKYVLYRLYAFAPRFQLIQAYLGTNVGLACVPELHTPEVLATLTDISINEHGELSYVRLGATRRLLPPEESYRFVVKPPDPHTRRPQVLSIYHPSADLLAAKGINMSRQVLDGLTAGALLTWRMQYGMPLPKKIEYFLDMRFREEECSEFDDQGRIRPEVVDVVAGWLGFKNAVSARFNYTSKAVNELGSPLPKALNTALNQRRVHLERYCPNYPRMNLSIHI